MSNVCVFGNKYNGDNYNDDDNNDDYDDNDDNDDDDNFCFKSKTDFFLKTKVQFIFKNINFCFKKFGLLNFFLQKKNLNNFARQIANFLGQSL